MSKLDYDYHEHATFTRYFNYELNNFLGQRDYSGYSVYCSAKTIGAFQPLADMYKDFRRLFHAAYYAGSGMTTEGYNEQIKLSKAYFALFKPKSDISSPPSAEHSRSNQADAAEKGDSSSDNTYKNR